MRRSGHALPAGKLGAAGGDAGLGSLKVGYLGCWRALKFDQKEALMRDEY